jgi:signal-transduction protein with cAMP-binding, CBS, and nucleotidyltransferase domain
MVLNKVHRLPVIEGGRLAGTVRLDDLAVRTGNLEVARQMTADLNEGALPESCFHERA